ncbi:hypothetical protein TGVAND_253600 [Toxoplasma gondii VAND]|uniref:Uncharacterized protein n=1 Tax=Toxoplasma gondii VAND TaxID=933077 RepID=A0A086Q1Q7_TOXGO|nr:hypothetical protein TGVAND_253600 [Toxoplasma gondii VAND]
MMEKKTAPPPKAKSKAPPPKAKLAAKGAEDGPSPKGPPSLEKKTGPPAPPQAKPSVPGETSPAPPSKANPPGAKPAISQQAPGDSPKPPGPPKTLPMKGDPGLPGKKVSVLVGTGPPSGPPKKPNLPGDGGPPTAGDSSPKVTPKKELPKVTPGSLKGAPGKPCSPGPKGPLSGKPPTPELGDGQPKHKMDDVKKSGLPVKTDLATKDLGIGTKAAATKKPGLPSGPPGASLGVKPSAPLSKSSTSAPPGASLVGAPGATPPSLPKPPGAPAETSVAKMLESLDEHGMRRGSGGRLAPQSSLEKEYSSTTMHSIFTRNGELVGRASGPAEPIATQDRSALPADRGRSRMRYQDPAAADRLPRPARSAETDRSSRRTPDLLSFFPFPGSMDGLPGVFVPVPAWPPPDQNRLAGGYSPFPSPHGARAPGMPGFSPFPAMPYPASAYGTYGQPGFGAWDPMAFGMPYYPPQWLPLPSQYPAVPPGDQAATAQGQVENGDEGDSRQRGRRKNAESPTGNAGSRLDEPPKKGKEGGVTFAFDHEEQGKPGESEKGAGTTLSERRRRRNTVLQILEDEGLELSKECIRALIERDEQDARDDRRKNDEESPSEMAGSGGFAARASGGDPEKTIGVTPWGSVEKGLNYIRSGSLRRKHPGDDDTAPARLPEDERVFDPAAFAKKRDEREARGEDPTFGTQEGDDYYKYFDPHYTRSKKPWYSEVAPRTGPPMPPRQVYGSLPRGGKFSSRLPKGWDRWTFEKGLTAPRKRTYQSLNELATYFTHLESEDQDEIVSLLLLCRKLEQQVEQQHVVIDMLEHDLTTANAALKFPPEWRALDEIDLVSLVPADTAFQPTTATPLFLKSANLLPAAVPPETAPPSSPQAAPKSAEAPKSDAAKAAKPAAPTGTKAPGIKAPGAGKKPVFKTTIKAAK